MDCPSCDAKTTVFETAKYEGDVYRKRRCLTCDYQFVTRETRTTDTEKMFDAFYQRGVKYRNRKRGKKHE